MSQDGIRSCVLAPHKLWGLLGHGADISTGKLLSPFPYKAH